MGNLRVDQWGEGWIICAPSTEGAGTFSQAGRIGVYPKSNCVYWTGRAWAPQKEQAKVYDFQDEAEGAMGREDVFQTVPRGFGKAN